MTYKGQEGGTIIEAVIAMIIMALLVIGLNGGVITIIKSNINSKDLNAATAAANRLFEEFRRSNYDTLATSVDIVENRYQRVWNVNKDDGNFATVTCTVRWPVPILNHQITLSTIISKN